MRIARGAVALAIAAAVAWAPALPAAAGVGRWTSQGPSGGEPLAVAFAPSRPRVMYAGGDRGEVFGSVDHGAGWKVVGDTGLARVVTLAVDPTDPGVVVAGSDAEQGAPAIAKSTDGGRTWLTVGPAGSTVGAIVIARSDPAILYATDGSQLLRSTDAGETWSLLAHVFRNAVTALAVDPTDPRVLFAGTQGQIFRSADAGLTWTLVDTIPSDEFPRVFAIAPTDPSVIYEGHDSGILKSEDGGATWFEADAGLPAGASVYSIAVDAASPGVAYAANRFAGQDPGAPVYRTADGGQSWTPASNGLPADWTQGVIADPHSPGVVFVSIQDRGLFGSPDGGATWRDAGHGLVLTTVNALLAGSGSTVFAGTDEGVFRSDDAGRTWVQLRGGLGSRSIRALAADPTARAKLFAATEDGVFRSSDGGRTWSATRMERPADDVAAATGQPLVYASGAGGEIGQVYRSTNGGRSWDIVFDGTGALAVDPSDPNVVFLGQATYGGIYRSTDRGATWDEVASLFVETLVFDPSNPSTIYAGLECGVGSECDQSDGPYGVWKSTDGGDTWNPMDTSLPNAATVHSVAIDPAHPQVVYAGTQDFGVYRSPDGGATWTPVGSLGGESVPALAVGTSGRAVHAGTYHAGVFEYAVPG